MKKLLALGALFATSCAFATVQLDVSIDINEQTYKNTVIAEEGESTSFTCGDYTVVIGAAPIADAQQSKALIAYVVTKGEEGESEEAANSLNTAKGLLMTDWNEKAETTVNVDDPATTIRLVVTASE